MISNFIAKAKGLLRYHPEKKVLYTDGETEQWMESLGQNVTLATHYHIPSIYHPMHLYNGKK